MDRHKTSNLVYAGSSPVTSARGGRVMLYYLLGSVSFIVIVIGVYIRERNHKWTAEEVLEILEQID